MHPCFHPSGFLFLIWAESWNHSRITFHHLGQNWAQDWVWVYFSECRCTWLQVHFRGRRECRCTGVKELSAGVLQREERVQVHWSERTECRCTWVEGQSAGVLEWKDWVQVYLSGRIECRCLSVLEKLSTGVLESAGVLKWVQVYLRVQVYLSECRCT